MLGPLSKQAAEYPLLLSLTHCIFLAHFSSPVWRVVVVRDDLRSEFRLLAVLRRVLLLRGPLL